MPTCISCHSEVSRDEPPRYDVLRPGVDLDDLSDDGPYCAACFAETATGKAMANAEPQ